MKINKKLGGILLLNLIFLVSCSDYLDINDDPNNVTSENIVPELILSGAQKRIFDTQAVTPNQLGQLFMNNWGLNVQSFSTGFVQEFTLNIDNTFYAGIWDSYYLRTANFHNLSINEQPVYTNFRAIGLILKSFYMQDIVDLYGDAPYFGAFQGGANLFPAYDDAKEIYRDLYANLDLAIELIDSAPTEALNPGANDAIMAGNMANWKKFANTIKLRLLVRESLATDGESITFVNSKFNELNASGAEFISSDVVINPGYTADTDRQSPFYDIFYNTDGTEKQGYQSRRGTKFAIDFLSGSSTGVSDARLGEIYDVAADGTYSGVIQGETSATAPSSISPVGTGLIQSASQDGYIMSLAEAKFLQAEAVEYGFLTSGSASALFTEAVVSSFEGLGLTAADATSYLAVANTSSTDGIGWNSTNKREAIMTQKWIALNGINAHQSWIDYTRTGFPEIPLSIVAEKTHKPYRLMYPNSELVGNSSNVPEQSQADVFTERIFWNQ
ncbi:SusD/RagB family nutrient-binding outer membrane lipoprotein [Lacinutrix himadriensis]|uniref:SusD/RagB family nutrient-binding outer membrane lipoprotein n=1 Tax=Lacinutrix himadriensis TaxID=641549 RepID=UPI0006E40456|nr:SusD/RagB family nutrient-binding outer membrane lipoprotein [Lacinutrix himadriensis]